GGPRPARATGRRRRGRGRRAAQLGRGRARDGRAARRAADSAGGGGRMTGAGSALRARRVDPGLPTLAAALDPAIAGRELAAAIPALAGLRVDAVRLLRHRPGRRAVIAYEGEAGRPARPVSLVAK